MGYKKLKHETEKKEQRKTSVLLTKGIAESIEELSFW